MFSGIKHDGKRVKGGVGRKYEAVEEWEMVVTQVVGLVGKADWNK
jgi:hypothetical protein